MHNWYKTQDGGWYRIHAEGAGPAVIYLYGTVGQDWWGEGTAAIDFARDLDALGSRDVELRVNSEGGDVFEGYAIYSAINRYPGKVTAFVDGLAASAASFLIMAADEIVMGQASCLFIHQAWTIALGNADELRDVATRLDVLDEQITGIYAARCNRDADELRATLAATKLFSAEEAIEWGLADRVDEGLKAAAHISRAAARLLFRDEVPEGIEVVEALEEPAASDTDSTIEPVQTAEASTEEAPEQELPAEDVPQEQHSARVVALASGVCKLNRATKGATDAH